MKITKAQLKDMDECVESDGNKECVECSASVCIMNYQKAIEQYNDPQTQSDIELAAAFKWIVGIGELNDIFIRGNEIEHLGYLIEVYRNREQKGGNL